MAGGLATGRTLPAAVLTIGMLGSALLLRGPRLPWRWVVGAIVLVILVIPIRQYSFGVSLPLDLEPYRLLLVLVLGLWIASLLVDPSTRLRATGLEGPLVLIVGGTIGSVIANPDRVAGVSDNVLKSLVFFITFILFLYFASSVLTEWKDIDFTVKLLVGGMCVLALSAIIEYRTEFSIFKRLDSYLPFLEKKELIEEDARGGRIRPRGSAEHALSWAGLCILTAPLALYLAATHTRRWLWAAPLIAIAALSSLSRTAVVMLIVVAITLIWMRPHHVRARARTVALILLPALVVLKLVVPGAVGTLRYEFFPAEGLLNEQSSSRGNLAAGGRLTDISFVVDTVSEKPLFGNGYGTRLRGQGSKDPKGRVIDNQWFSTAVDVGLIAVVGWLWLIGRVVRRMGRLAREGPRDAAWLGVSINAGLLALTVGMVTFDAFSFVQVTFVMYVVLALACAAWAIAGRAGHSDRDAAP